MTDTLRFTLVYFLYCIYLTKKLLNKKKSFYKKLIQYMNYKKRTPIKVGLYLYIQNQNQLHTNITLKLAQSISSLHI